MQAYDLYYHLKPIIPRWIQLHCRRHLTRHIAKRSHGRWPIDRAVAGMPDGWNGWPDGKQFALVLTHDIESQLGHDRCADVMEMESRMGFRSCFNFVPERYAVSEQLLDRVRSGGFEVGVHGLKHDGHLFRSRRVFRSRAPRINRYLKDWNASGFRSPSMRHNLDWMGELDLMYDSSTFDTDPFEPSPRGAGTIFPFIVEAASNHKRYVELPYTLPQDFTLFVILRYDNIDLWKTKLDWLAKKGGMVLLNTHPDYMSSGNVPPNGEQYPAEHYRHLLEFVKEKYQGKFWHALPKDVAAFWRSNYPDDVHRSGDVGRQIGTRSCKAKREKIWIDLDNTPHVPFFKPIIAELEARGYETAVTARRAFQVCELARSMGVAHKEVGRHYGKIKLIKALGLFYRAIQLAPFAWREKPGLSLSHGSRSQIIISHLLGIPSVLISDYEYTKALPLMHPNWEIVPEVVSAAKAHCRADRVCKYSGIKEDVYVPFFRPDPDNLADLGLPFEGIVATVRPPATEAHYHNPESEPLFAEAMKMLCETEDVRVVLLPRNAKQGDWIRRRWPEWFSNGKVLIPDRAVDGLNLLWHSDLVISGGGTMNREAAALGIPVYSIFRGTIGAVDRHLTDTGRLLLLETVEDVRSKVKIGRHHIDEEMIKRPRPALGDIVAHVEEIIRATKG